MENLGTLLGNGVGFQRGAGGGGGSSLEPACGWERGARLKSALCCVWHPGCFSGLPPLCLQPADLVSPPPARCHPGKRSRLWSMRLRPEGGRWGVVGGAASLARRWEVKCSGSEAQTSRRGGDCCCSSGSAHQELDLFAQPTRSETLTAPSSPIRSLFSLVSPPPLNSPLPRWRISCFC